MIDALAYIREAIAKHGDNAKVDVVRWEKNFKTGYYSKPFKVLIKANIALAELSKPINKRSFIWKYIRPLGMTMDGNINAPEAGNRLNDPALIEQLKAELKAELAAEMRAESEAQPKRRRKSAEADVESQDGATPNELSTDLENA
jgi:hypothetical protein